MADTSTIHNALNDAATYEAGYFETVQDLLGPIRNLFERSDFFTVLTDDLVFTFGFFDSQLSLQPLVIQ